VIAIGAGTLADIYEPAERGSKIGLYYAAPLLGSSLGPILGGSLTQGFNWRAVFWFLVIFAGLNFFSFLLLFKDTFRRERSSTYQAVLKQRTQERDQAASQLTVDNSISVKDASPIKEIKLSLADVNPFPPLLIILGRWNNLAILLPSGKFSMISFTLSLRRHYSYCTSLTGLLFAFSFSITYTCARTMSNKYKYNALQTGLVLLAYGIGVLSSIVIYFQPFTFTVIRVLDR
jgi:MFS family permease